MPRAAASSRSHRGCPGRRVALGPHAPDAVDLVALRLRVDLAGSEASALPLVVEYALTPTTTCSPASIAALDPVGGLLDRALLEARLDGRQRAAESRRSRPGSRWRPASRCVGERLDVVAARQRVRRLGHARLVGQDLLGPEREPAPTPAVGRASASSRAFVCRIWAPPRTAASAWTVVRTTLLSIDWAVRLDAGRLDVEAAHHRARIASPRSGRA